jgi:general secretion pathway protein H
MTPSRHALRAMSLLEVSVGIALLGLMMAVAAPAVGALTGAQLKEHTGLLSGAIRDTFSRTALMGRTTRLVVDLDENAWWIEESNTLARVKSIKERANKDGKMTLNPVDERIEGIDADTRDVREQSKLQLLTGPAFAPVEGEDGQPHKLPSDVRFKLVWTEHHDEPALQGQAALYFFPGGYSEEAVVVLTDADKGSTEGDVYVITVQPLTGEVYIDDEEPRRYGATEEDD